MYVRKKNFHVSCTWYKSLFETKPDISHQRRDQNISNGVSFSYINMIKNFVIKISVHEEPQAIWSFWLFIKKTSIIFFMWVDLIFESFSWKEKNATAIGAEGVWDQNQILELVRVTVQYRYMSRNFQIQVPFVDGDLVIYILPMLCIMAIASRTCGGRASNDSANVFAWNDLMGFPIITCEISWTWKGNVARAWVERVWSWRRLKGEWIPPSMC